MINPFSQLSRPLLEALVASGKKFFIRQSFNRPRGEAGDGIKAYFILTHYAEKGHAEHHYGAISEDPHRYMYSWDKQEHRGKLLLAAEQPEGYRIFASVFNKDWEKHITVNLKQKLRIYVESKLGWKPSVAETVAFDIYVSYGELYAKLKLRSQEVRVKLEEIENYHR